MSQKYVYVAQKNVSKVITGTNCLRKLLSYNTYKRTCMFDISIDIW